MTHNIMDIFEYLQTIGVIERELNEISNSEIADIAITDCYESYKEAGLLHCYKVATAYFKNPMTTVDRLVRFFDAYDVYLQEASTIKRELHENR